MAARYTRESMHISRKALHSIRVTDGFCGMTRW